MYPQLIVVNWQKQNNLEKKLPLILQPFFHAKDDSAAFVVDQKTIFCITSSNMFFQRLAKSLKTFYFKTTVAFCRSLIPGFWLCRWNNSRGRWRPWSRGHNLAATSASRSWRNCGCGTWAACRPWRQTRWWWCHLHHNYRPRYRWAYKRKISGHIKTYPGSISTIL